MTSLPGPHRLPARGRLSSAAQIPFEFNGRPLMGLDGDTLASALLANNIRVVARSFKFHRPRGVFAAGVEEPNAIVSVGAGATLEPNVRATMQPLYAGLSARSQNVWPSLGFDIGRCNDFIHALLPAGFYNKTFKWPSWHTYEGAIRRAAGRGPALTVPDGDRYEARNISVDVVVVGGGVCGLLAAISAAEAGASVLLVEQDRELGGAALSDSSLPGEFLSSLIVRLLSNQRVKVLTRSTAVAVYDHGVLTILQRPGIAAQQSECRERLWCTRTRELILATGAIEQPLMFGNNDLPGVMLSSAVREYQHRYAVACGRAVLFATNNDDAYRTAADLAAAGIQVPAIIDARRAVPRHCHELLRASNVNVISNARIDAAIGRGVLRGAWIIAATGDRVRIECDVLAVSGGWNPTLHLFSQARGTLRFSHSAGCLVPSTYPAHVHVIGAAAAEFDPVQSWVSAIQAGRRVAGQLGYRANVTNDRALELPQVPSHSGGPPELTQFSSLRQRSRIWIDLAHDVTVSDIDLAVTENFVSVEHVKRYTTVGMSVDQGKTSNLNALLMLAQSTRRGVDETGTTTFRPPFTPVSLGAFSAGRTGAFYRPIRELPAHVAHVQGGARMEELAGWWRAAAYPRSGESEHAAAVREARAVRNSVGIYDASSLGKLLVCGPDAGEFLNRIYASDIASLRVGSARYGLMLREQGTILDDGICARLGTEEYWVGASSGAVARVADWLESWLQLEWPTQRVTIANVTSQWATLTIAGPRARELLQSAGISIDLAAAAFPHMSVRDGELHGWPCRLMRVSFSGELSYEISVPAGHGEALWRHLLAAGAAFDITPYGTEALQTLRTEKGFIHVGADTDATTVPDDVGLSRLFANKQSDFLGRRSLSLADHVRPDRLQLVGVQCVDLRRSLPVGAHIVSADAGGMALRSGGYVTSAYFSPAANRYIGLALVAGGRARHGEVVQLFDDGQQWPALIGAPCSFDGSGGRMRG